MTEESIQQRRLRLYREKKARDASNVEKTRQRAEQKNKSQQIVSKQKTKVDPEAMKLALVVKSKVLEQEKLDAAKALVKAERIRWRLCSCCGDDKDIKENGMCVDCWREKVYGIIEPPKISDRQIKSAECRNVRKGHEMS